MKKIRVLHILDELNTGGAERIVTSYFKFMDRSLFTWEFVVTRYSDKDKVGLLEPTVLGLGGKIYYVPRKRENYLANIAAIDKIIANGNYDIVHSHLDELSAIYLLSAKIHHVPVRICHSHLSGTDRGRGVELLCKLFRPLMFAVTTDKFACGIDAGKALWGKKCMENNDVHIMNNAIEVNKFAFKEEIRKKKRDELGLQKNTVLGSVGRLSYQKNPEFILKTFNNYHNLNRNSTLLLIGEGDKKEELQEYIDKYNLNDSVILLGRREDVNELMMAMDIFLLPSRFEGLPIVLVEAQCSGLPCFVSDNITKEIAISQNIFYLSLTKSPKAWANYIYKKFKMNDRLTGLKLVEEANYDIKKEALVLQNYYREAVKRNAFKKDI